MFVPTNIKFCNYYIAPLVLCVAFFALRCSTPGGNDRTSQLITTDTAELVSKLAHAEKVSVSRPDSAIVLFQEIINEIEALRLLNSDSCSLRSWGTEKKIMAIQGIAVSHTNTGDFDLALKGIGEGLELVERGRVDTCLKLHKVKERLLSSRSIVQKKQGNYLSAIETLRELLELAEEHKDISGRAIYLTNIGNAYQELGEHNLAIDYIGRAIKLHEITGNRRGVAVCKLTLANIYNTTGRFNEARSNYIETLTELTNLGYTGHVGLVQSNLGVLEKRQGNFLLAREYFNKALSSLTIAGNKSGLAMVWGNIADLANEAKNYSEAVTFAKLQLDEAIRSSNLINQRYAFKHLYKAYKGLGHTKEALQNYEEFVSIKDSIASTEKRNEVARLEAKYQDAKKKEEIKHLEALSELLQERNKQKSILLLALGALGLSVLAAGGFWLRAIRLNSKRKALDLEQRLLRSQMNPHFVFNSLTSIQSMILKEERDKASEVVLSFARLMRLILESSREEYITFSQEIEIVERYAQLQKLRFPNRFTLSVRLEPENLGEDILTLPLLLQPFVENSIEHAFTNESNGTIAIDISQEGAYIICKIEDDGLGFDTNVKRSYSDHKSLATQITRERLELIQGKLKQEATLKIESPLSKGGGTRVTIKIPKMIAN